MTVLDVIDSHQRTVLELLIAGVAFRKEKEFEIISHAGDYIGTVSIHMVESTVCRMRRIGYERSAYPHPGAITYGFERWVDHNQVERLMDDYFKSPVIVH